MSQSVAFPVDVNTKAYTKAMKIISKEALPDAIAETLNRTADATTKQQIKNVKKNLIVRTPFTLRSMESRGARPWKALNKARGKNISRMFSRAGTFSNYLWLQEESSRQTGINGPVPIPTLQARTAKKLKKSIRKIYRLNRSTSLRDGQLFGQTGYQRLFVGVPIGGNRSRGLYERSANNKRLKMIRNLGSNTIRIKGTGFHSKAVKKFGTKQFIAAQYKKVFFKAMKKRGVA